MGHRKFADIVGVIDDERRTRIEATWRAVVELSLIHI